MFRFPCDNIDNEFHLSHKTEEMIRISLFLLFVSGLRSFEVFTFLLRTERAVWSRLDWARLTTLCYAGWEDRELTETAHSHGARGEPQHKC